MMRCFYDPGYYLPLPREHPFPMDKFVRAYEYLRNCGDVIVHQVEPASRLQLERVHHPDYLNAVRDDGLSRYDRNRLGLPHKRRLLDRSARETAGTVAAAWAALEEGVSCNLAGGTHHAFANQGLGFCVLNDVAVAVAELRATGFDGWILVVDTDAHQGNGTHALLRNDPRVFTYSIHVGRNYPARKEPGDCDVPLPRHVQGEDYLTALKHTLPNVFQSFEPDLVFWIAGADIHADDAFGQMLLSFHEIKERDERILILCQEWACPVVVLYGGGYNADRRVTARLHAETVLRAQVLLDCQKNR